MWQRVSVTLLWFTLYQSVSGFWPGFPSNTETNQDSSSSAVDFHQTAQATNAEVCSCLEEIGYLEKQLQISHNRHEHFQHRIDELAAQIYNIQNAMRLITSGMKSAGQTQDVSFSAKVTSSRAYLKDTDAIIFDDILTNNAGAYDPNSGRFTAPAVGVYHFSATILSGFNTTIESMFAVNGEEVGRLYSGAFNNRGSGTNSILVNLKRGDEVSVNLFYGNGDYVHGQWSTFSGYAVSLFN